MDLNSLYDHLLDYFQQDFDHSLVIDQDNDPYVEICEVNLSTINPHCDSRGIYLAKPGKPAVHTMFTTTIMATARMLEGKYLIQKPSSVVPIEDTYGYIRGLVMQRHQIILVTAVTNLEDARFVCQSTVNQIKILAKLP